MRRYPFIKQLDQMVGQVYVYGGQSHYIKEYKVDEDYEKVIIETNTHRYERNFESIDAFLKYWQPANIIKASNLPAKPEENEPLLSEEEASIMGFIGKALMENITKVQADASFIPQAKAINNNANSLINLIKVKVIATKQRRKL